MKLLRLLLLLLLGTLAGPLAAAPAGGPWPATEASVWSIKTTDYPDQPGAVILLDRYHFHRKTLERFRRVLVLNESGRSLADIRLSGAPVAKLEGRTLLPDGKETPFVQGKDVVKSELVVGKREKEEIVKIFPPGVTSHCIVDVRWFETVDDPEKLPAPSVYGYNLLISLSSVVPVKRAEVVFDPDLSDAGWMRKVEVDPGQKRTEEQKNGVNTYVFEDIPTRKVMPLASKAEAYRPLISWFWSPQVRDWLTYLGFPADKPVNLLEAAARTFIYEWWMVPLEKDSALRNELQAMAKGTEGQEPHARALALIRQLRARVRTLGELEDRPDWKGRGDSLAMALRRGWGSSQQLTHLGFLLLRESGMEVALTLVIDREDNRLIDPNNIWQYDQLLVGVKDAKGQWLYLDPGSTFEPLGVPPWLQGSRALQVIPAAKRLEWRAAFTSLPLVEASRNTQTWTISLTPGEESDAYGVALEATGSMAARWKLRVQNQRSSETQKALAPILERGRFRLAKAEGKDLLDPWKGFKVAFEGNLEHDGGRRRMLRPFLFVEPPFTLPDAWPDPRTVPIHLPMACQIQAEARLPWGGGPLPEEGMDPLERENAFGKVSWKAELEEGGKVLVVRLRMEVTRPLGSAMQYGQLQAFSSWIGDALGRTVPAPRP